MLARVAGCVADTLSVCIPNVRGRVSCGLMCLCGSWVCSLGEEACVCCVPVGIDTVKVGKR